MRTAQYILLIGFISAGLFSVVAFAHSQQSVSRTNANSNSATQNSSRPKFEYATLTTQAIQENNGMVYTVTWNAGEQDVIGRSTTTLVDARRRLTALLDGGNRAHTNLSVMLTSFGSDGWRLIETTQNEYGVTRIFVRAQV